ncbi:MAG: domain S-box-containing protein [Modestobacter sp.]|nr:domain S-box-containing protein [Modestobacter sp.]
MSPLSHFSDIDEHVAGPSPLAPDLHFRALVEACAEGVYLVDTSGICIYANPAVGEMLGHDVAALIGTDIHSVIHHSHADGSPFPRAECPLYRAAVAGVPCEVTDQVLWRADGTPLPVDYRTGSLVVDGRLVGAVVTFTDATERRATMAELAGIVDTAGDAFLGIDDDSLITGWNEAARTLLGWTADEVVGRHIVEAIVPVRHRGEYSHRLQALHEAPDRDFPRGPVELVAQHKDGREVTTELTIGRMRKADRFAFHAFLRDVTERRAIMRSLERSEALHRLLTERSTDLISRHTADGRFLYVSPASSALLGMRPADLIGRTMRDLAHPDDVATLAGATADLDTSERPEVTVRLRHRDGSWVWVESVLSALSSEDGTIEVQAHTRDITDRQVREAELQQASRLEALGRLSAGLAHEINTPIQFMGDNTRFLADSCRELLRMVQLYRDILGSPEPLSLAARQARARQAEATSEIDYLQAEIPSAIEQTLAGMDRVATIVRAMRAFSDPGRSERADADLNEVLGAALTVARHQVNAFTDVRLELADLPLVRCNVADLRQAFLHLIVNAVDAIEETGQQRGAITVATSAEGGHVTVSISDTGTGIPDDVLPMIFDPFFTTKDVGKGKGQGLALVRAVVQEGHGGTLLVASEPGAGSTFTVRLPIAGEPQPG